MTKKYRLASKELTKKWSRGVEVGDDIDVWDEGEELEDFEGRARRREREDERPVSRHAERQRREREDQRDYQRARRKRQRDMTSKP